VLFIYKEYKTYRNIAKGTPIFILGVVRVISKGTVGKRIILVRNYLANITILSSKAAEVSTIGFHLTGGLCLLKGRGEYRGIIRGLYELVAIYIQKSKLTSILII